MDTKALAKSKRAHSLHHSKKHHPNPKAKAQASSASVSSSKKPTGKLEVEKLSQTHVSRELPSNWDRYEDENVSGLEESLTQVSSGQVYEVAPKSKGADYAHLIAEAKAQSHASYSLEDFSLLKNPRDEFDLGLGPLLSIKGDRMLSWFSEYSFLLDDKNSGSCEASFLSLNLDVLAKQLEKADLAELLFVEPDILFSESVSNFQETIEKIPDECSSATGSSKATKTTRDVYDLNPISKEDRNIHRHDENVLSEPKNNRIHSSPDVIGIAHSAVLHRQSKEASLNKSRKPTTSDLSPDPSAMEPSRFKAAAAEAELDMLLDSFSETNISNPNCFVMSSGTERSTNHSSKMLGGSSFPPDSVPMQHMKKVGDPEHFMDTTTNLNNDLDDLLKETSNLMEVNRKSTLHDELKAAASRDVVVSASDPDSKSKLLDDFDSWLDTI